MAACPIRPTNEDVPHLDTSQRQCVRSCCIGKSGTEVGLWWCRSCSPISKRRSITCLARPWCARCLLCTASCRKAVVGHWKPWTLCWRARVVARGTRKESSAFAWMRCNRSSRQKKRRTPRILRRTSLYSGDRLTKDSLPAFLSLVTIKQECLYQADLMRPQHDRLDLSLRVLDAGSPNVARFSCCKRVLHIGRSASNSLLDGANDKRGATTRAHTLSQHYHESCSFLCRFNPSSDRPVLRNVMLDIRLPWVQTAAMET